MKVRIVITDVYDSIELEKLLKMLQKVRQLTYVEMTENFTVDINVKNVKV